MNTKLIIHIVISLISLSGLIVYYYAFLLGYTAGHLVPADFQLFII